MSNRIEKILVIEDNHTEALYAQTALGSAGFNEVEVAPNLSMGLKELPNYHAVLTDLFFPAGEISTEQYSQRFLPFYERFKQSRFPRQNGGIVLAAVRTVAETFGMAPQGYVENVVAKLNTPPVVLRAARDAVAGIKDSDRYQAFLKIEEGIRNGTNLPLGIIVCEEAGKLGMPSVIVTSAHHHSDAFGPVSSLIQVPYRDDLVDGKKDWKGGIEILLREE